jgi:hypothetical protein
MSSEICATDTPSRPAPSGAAPGARPGAPGRRMAAGAARCAAGSRCAQRRHLHRQLQQPAQHHAAGQARMGCTPQASNSGAPSQAAAITLRFSSTGVSAGTAKRFQVLRMPADRPPATCSRCRGTSSAPSAPRCRKSCSPAPAATPAPARPPRPAHAGQQQHPGQHGGHGVDQAWVAASPSRSRWRPARARRPARRRPRQTAGATGWAAEGDVEGVGQAAPAPNCAAISCSRTSPVTRDNSVSSETVEAALSRFTGGEVGARAGTGRQDYRQPARIIGSGCPPGNSLRNRAVLYSTVFAPTSNPLIQHGHLVQSQEEDRSPRLRPQARPPGRGAQRRQHLAALALPHRREERAEGRGRWRQGQGADCSSPPRA